MAITRDPWAPPEKVRDEHAERLLGEVLAAIRDLNGRQEQLEVALQKMVDKFTRSLPEIEPVDMTPVAAAIREIGNKPQPNLERALVEELWAIFSELHMKPDDWDRIARQIADAVSGQKTTIIGGGGGGGRLRNTNNTEINPATEDTLADIKRGITDQETRFDYGARTDSSPVYIGKADDGTATTETTWTIQKLTYDASDRVTRIEVGAGAWDDRSTMF